jgi:hypothetical protein
MIPWYWSAATFLAGVLAMRALVIYSSRHEEPAEEPSLQWSPP